MAMPDVYDEMFKYLKKYLSENSSYSPKVLKDTPPSKYFPLVIMKEVQDDLYSENMDKTDQRFNIGYEIEIFTMDKDNIAKQTIADEIKKLINDVFDEHYGMNRKTNKQLDNADTDVYRWYMLYEAKIDENKNIYRR